jgi:hypothetical protein
VKVVDNNGNITNVPGPFRRIAASNQNLGGSYSLGIRSDGTITLVAGTAPPGLLGLIPQGRFIDIACGSDYACAIRADGVPVFFGFGAVGLSMPAGVYNRVSIASQTAGGARRAVFMEGVIPSSTAFNYQGELFNAGTANQADTDFRFRLFSDSVRSDSQIGLAQKATILATEFSGGRFSVELDFGLDAFDGTQRWLEISIRQPATGVDNDLGFTVLTPRQRLLNTPSSIFAFRALESRDRRGHRGCRVLRARSGRRASRDCLDRLGRRVILGRQGRRGCRVWRDRRERRGRLGRRDLPGRLAHRGRLD